MVYVSRGTGATSSLDDLLAAAEGQIPAGTNLIGKVEGPNTHGLTFDKNPFVAGLQSRTSNYSAKGNGNVTSWVGTQAGAGVIKPFSIPELDWVYAAASGGIVNSSTAVTLKAAGAAGICNYITGIDISHDALGAATEIAVRDGAAGTVLWRMKLQTAALPLTSIRFTTPLRGTAATLIEFLTITNVTGGVYVNARGYQAP